MQHYKMHLLPSLHELMCSIKEEQPPARTQVAFNLGSILIPPDLMIWNLIHEIKRS